MRDDGIFIAVEVDDQAAADSELAAKLTEIWHVRGDRYSELRSQNTVDPAIGERKVEMSYIGG